MPTYRAKADDLDVSFESNAQKTWSHAVITLGWKNPEERLEYLQGQVERHRKEYERHKSGDLGEWKIAQPKSARERLENAEQKLREFKENGGDFPGVYSRHTRRELAVDKRAEAAQRLETRIVELEIDDGEQDDDPEVVEMTDPKALDRAVADMSPAEKAEALEVLKAEGVID